MQPEDYREKNRAAWNQAAPIHKAHREVDLHAAVQSPSFNILGEVEQKILAEIGIKTAVLHSFAATTAEN